MADINDYILHPENRKKSPERLDREQTLEKWNHDIARQIAQQENLELQDAHWALINFLRDNYLQHGLPKSSHELTQLLDTEFSQQGGIRHLYLLFPDGPIAQGSRIAGIPVAHDAEDESFGSVQ
jgi:tRNA 2-thiouridine synthesizing protein E